MQIISVLKKNLKYVTMYLHKILKGDYQHEVYRQRN